MSSTAIDTKRFHKRLRLFQTKWKDSANNENFRDVKAILLLVGDEDAQNIYRKSLAMQTWLLGFPIYNTLFLITPDKITIACRKKLGDKLQVLQKDDKHDVVDIVKLTDSSEENVAMFTPLIEQLASSKVGILLKDKFQGAFVDEWTKVLNQSGKSFEEEDISTAISVSLGVKDEDELRSMRLAAKSSSNVMTHYFIDEMKVIIDKEMKVKHSTLADRIEDVLYNNASLKKIRLPADIDPRELEWCYNPIVQSGGVYDLRSSAISNDENLHEGVILCSFGVRYKYYCSNIGRTFLISPSKTQEKNYKFLVHLQNRVLDSIRHGVKIKDIYLKAYSLIKAERPDLEKNFTKSIGFAIGIEFRDSTYLLNAKNVRELKNGMVLNVSLGFADLENPNPVDKRSNKYSLLLIDTVRVTNEGPVVLTECTKQLDNVSFIIGDEEEADEEAKEKPATKASKVKKEGAPSKTVILRHKFRSEEQDEVSREQKRREHQRQLHTQKQTEGLARFSESSGNDQEEDKAVFRRFESYRSIAKLPRRAQEPKLIVDRENDSVILPIYGMSVPFHISTLKNVSKNEEGEFVALRINFLTPGQAGGKKENMPFDNVNATFVRALTFRSANAHRMAEVYRDITELKKASAKKEAERKEMADVIEQDNLILVKGRRPEHLSDVYARPQMDGKRLPGDLEIHVNGLRYQPIGPDNGFNILFSNIKHLFFQPCTNELLVIIHIHLKNPIIIGKRKTKDIQFYREASEIQYDETGNKRRRHAYGDEDEIEAEQEERRRRANLNREFNAFAEKIAGASDRRVEVDSPVRQLAFNGVPFRSNVLLQPTTDCLVHLTDPPFLVITLSEIEIAHLERVQFGLKNFDMVFVFKDFHRTPIHINTIPMPQVDNVKDWLDSMDVAFTEGPVNLNWGMIMKTVNEDPAEFYKNGGWSFLGDGSDGEDSEGQSETGSEFEDDEEAEESSSEEESDFEDDASDDDASEDDMSESGEDWDELEEKARQADERKLKRNLHDDEGRGAGKKARRR